MIKYATISFRILRLPELHEEMMERFQNCKASFRKTGEQIQERIPASIEDRWPADVLVVSPSASDLMGFNDQLEWLCIFISTHRDYLQQLRDKGASLDAYIGVGFPSSVGSISLPESPIKKLAQVGAAVFVRIVTDPVFADEP